MSFGRPPSISRELGVNPPDRGSFPLDHYGECKEYMKSYLNCLRKNSSTSTPCRHLNREYLDCRMSNGLMDRDDWKNLGLSNLPQDKAEAPTDLPSSSSSSTASGTTPKS
ncbi:Cytochrome c oxidase assembly protein cox19 [Steccherinum ochraceum]|uniref:Cytochrome c oxidase assembly protein cox19 n=1 Tax=Steccherinum ochraceum TaxID=92696 RepID=A0A4R0RA22_9APHY|nr:Cytochrome c oxidase assembly protein cox19 [Steccherinum ochraceum]